jgi:membrane-bound ClpP family serine protease
MEWITVISLILFGLALVIVEIIFIPGTTVVGLLGFVFGAVGVGLSFRYFGAEIGWITLGSTAVVSGLVLYYAFKSDVWSRFALKSSIDGKVNEGALATFQPGQEGVAVSALRPIGKAELSNRTVEVKTQGEYVEPGTKVRIVRIVSNSVIVEPIN